MVASVITLTRDMKLTEAWSVFFEHRISGAPVVDADGTVVGVLSQTDLARETFAEGISDFPKNTFYFDVPYFTFTGSGQQQLSDRLSHLRVEDVMTTDPLCAAAETPVEELARLMRERHVHRLIVTDRQKVSGIVTTFDLLKLIESR